MRDASAPLRFHRERRPLPPDVIIYHDVAPRMSLRGIVLGGALSGSIWLLLAVILLLVIR